MQDMVGNPKWFLDFLRMKSGMGSWEFKGNPPANPNQPPCRTTVINTMFFWGGGFWRGVPLASNDGMVSWRVFPNGLIMLCQVIEATTLWEITHVGDL